MLLLIDWVIVEIYSIVIPVVFLILDIDREFVVILTLLIQPIPHHLQLLIPLYLLVLYLLLYSLDYSDPPWRTTLIYW